MKTTELKKYLEEVKISDSTALAVMTAHAAKIELKNTTLTEALEFIRDNGMTSTKELIVQISGAALPNAQAQQ